MYFKVYSAEYWLFFRPRWVNLPVSQSVPSYPSAHAQLYPLTVSAQVPEFWQGSLAHSSVSAQTHWNKTSVYMRLMPGVESLNQGAVGWSGGGGTGWVGGTDGPVISVTTTFELNLLSGLFANVWLLDQSDTRNSQDSKRREQKVSNSIYDEKCKQCKTYVINYYSWNIV